MAIELSPELQARIQEKIDEGEFPDAETIVSEGLDLIDSSRGIALTPKDIGQVNQALEQVQRE